MPRSYRHAGGRIQQRANDGQFRQSTLGDLGLGTRPCNACGALNPYRLLTDNRETGGFVEKAPPPIYCEKCREALS